MKSLAISLLGFVILLPLVSLAVWAAMGYWPRFRNRAALLRVTEVVALVLGMVIFIGRRGPAPAEAAPPPPPPPPPQIVVPGKPAATRAAQSKSLPATIMDVDGRSFLVAELPVVASSQPVNVKLSSATSSSAGAAAPSASSALGPIYTDENNGFAMRFPAGWAMKSFDDNENWVLGVTDGHDAVITVGFSKLPSGTTADQIKLDAVARTLKAQPNTTVESQGYAKIDGRKSVWSRSTGPVTVTSRFAPRMTRVQYLVPLNDGRALELRIAATPEQFDKLAPLMKQSAASIKLLARDRKGAN